MVRHPAPWRRYAGRPLRQRPDLSESTLSRGVSRLPAPAGVHHTVHARAERVIERFSRSLKEECVWQHSFVSFEHARRELSAWIRWHNEERPHHALGYRSPRDFRAHEVDQVARFRGALQIGGADHRRVYQLEQTNFM